MRLKLGLALAAAVSAFLLVWATGTAALWRDQATVNPGTISTGSLILLNGDQTSQVKNYQLSDFSAAAISPGASKQAPLVVKNAGNTPFLLNLKGITATSGSPSLLQSFVISIAQVNLVGDCPLGSATTNGLTLYQGSQQANAVFTSQPRLAAGASLVLCLRGVLGTDAAQSTDQTGFQLFFGFRADQSR